jgi:hypothetical protein
MENGVVIFRRDVAVSPDSSLEALPVQETLKIETSIHNNEFERF